MGQEPREARKGKEIMSDIKDAADIAADYIEGLTRHRGPRRRPRDYEFEWRDYVSIVATDSDHLKVLTKGDTVSALQELTRLAVHTKTGEFSRLILDVAGSRDARSKELERLVERAIERIEGGAQSQPYLRCRPDERKLSARLRERERLLVAFRRRRRGSPHSNQSRVVSRETFRDRNRNLL